MLRPATVDDYIKFYGRPPAYPETWIGFVGTNRYMIMGIGGLYWGDRDRWWACLDRAPGCKGLRELAEASRLIMRTAKAMEIDVYALADPRIEGAEKLLRRLRFEPTEETYKGNTVWKLEGDNGAGNRSGGHDRERPDRGRGDEDASRRDGLADGSAGQG